MRTLCASPAAPGHVRLAAYAGPSRPSRWIDATSPMTPADRSHGPTGWPLVPTIARPMAAAPALAIRGRWTESRWAGGRIAAPPSGAFVVTAARSRRCAPGRKPASSCVASRFARARRARGAGRSSVLISLLDPRCRRSRAARRASQDRDVHEAMGARSRPGARLLRSSAFIAQVAPHHRLTFAGHFEIEGYSGVRHELRGRFAPPLAAGAPGVLPVRRPRGVMAARVWCDVRRRGGGLVRIRRTQLCSRDACRHRGRLPTKRCHCGWRPPPSFRATEVAIPRSFR